MLLLIILVSFTFGSLLELDTSWGKCIIDNIEISISNTDLKKQIHNKIYKLEENFGPIAKKKNFTIIITNQKNIIKHKHWSTSLGITYTNPDKIIIKDPSSSHITLKRFEQVLEHELNHLMMNRLKVVHTVPRWFKEGFAMYYADEISLRHKLNVAEKIYNQSLFNIFDLKTFHHFNATRYKLAYSQSAIYILYIQKMFGNYCLENIFYNLKNNNSFEMAFYKATNKNLNEFNEDSYLYIKNKYKWYRLMVLPNRIFTLLPLLLTIVFIIKSIKNRKIEKEWEIEEELEELKEL